MSRPAFFVCGAARGEYCTSYLPAKSKMNAVPAICEVLLLGI
jgi:hypothetical protein